MENPAEPEPKARRGWGTFEKVLLGCGIGCGVLGLTALIAAVAGVRWIVAPGEQVPPETILGEESVGAVRVHDLAQDAGARELLHGVWRDLQELDRQRQRETLPPSLKWMTELQGQSLGHEVNYLIPSEVVVSLERANGGDAQHFVVAANFRAMVRPIKKLVEMVAGADAATVEQYLGYEIVPLGDDAALAFVKSTLIVSDASAALRRAIDRIGAGKAAPTSPAVAGGVLRSSAVLGFEWDVHAVVGGGDPLIEELLAPADRQGIAGEAPVDRAVEELFVGLDIVSAETAQLRVVLLCADDGSATALRQILERRGEELVDRLGRFGVVVEPTVRIEGRQAVADFRLTGLRSSLAAWMAEAGGFVAPSTAAEPTP